MGTKDFNIFDKVISKLRLAKIVEEISKGDVILDFGCGSQAYFLKQVARLVDIGYGIDYDVDDKKFGNIILSKAKIGDNLKYLDCFFDKVVMLAVLEHLDIDKIAVLFQEFSRVLKPNGKLIMTTPTPFSKPLLELLASLRIINSAEIHDHKKYYSKKDIVQLAGTTNFVLEKYSLFQLGLNSKIILKKK